MNVRVTPLVLLPLLMSLYRTDGAVVLVVTLMMLLFFKVLELNDDVIRLSVGLG